LDTGTAAAAVLTTQGVRDTNPRETGYINQDVNDGFRAEHASSPANNTTTSKIIKNQSISEKAYDWKLVSSLNFPSFQEQIFPIVTLLVDQLPKNHEFYLLWQQGLKEKFHKYATLKDLRRIFRKEIHE
jgi:hypothetical protein